MFSLNMVDYPMSFLLLYTWNFFCWRSRGEHSKMFLLIVFCCGTPPSCFKVMGWVVGGWLVVVVVAWSNLVSAQGPLVLGLGLKGLTTRAENQFCWLSPRNTENLFCWLSPQNAENLFCWLSPRNTKNLFGWPSPGNILLTQSSKCK